MDNIQINMPDDVKKIISILAENGFEAYAVGGCVRDSLLGRNPDDWDVTTNALPHQIKKIFMRTVDTGIKHGTVTVLFGNGAYEVTTYRIDGKYTDNRHPDDVTFTASLEEDLKRRDFTINAMAYNDENGLIDIFGARDDLLKKKIRCVGEAKERFLEDALRMMRAVRFAAQLGFDIDKDTYNAISLLSKNITNVSAERICSELKKLLLSENPQMIRLLYESGITAHILPEFDIMMNTAQNNPHHIYSVGEHTIESLRFVKADVVLRFAMLLHDVGKPDTKKTDDKGMDHFCGHPMRGEKMANNIMHRLKFDNITRKAVCRLVRWHDDRPPLSEVSIRKAIFKIGVEAYPDLFAIKRADMLAQSTKWRAEKEAYIDEYEAIYNRIIKRGDCLSIKELKINGTDIINLGETQGRHIGDILSRILEHVITKPEDNNREILLDMARKFVNVYNKNK